jgi:hypothetical protein
MAVSNKFPKMSKKPIVVLDLPKGQMSSQSDAQKIQMKVKDLFNVFLQLCLWEGFQEIIFD